VQVFLKNAAFLRIYIDFVSSYDVALRVLEKLRWAPCAYRGRDSVRQAHARRAARTRRSRPFSIRPPSHRYTGWLRLSRCGTGLNGGGGRSATALRSTTSSLCPSSASRGERWPPHALSRCQRHQASAHRYQLLLFGLAEHTPRNHPYSPALLDAVELIKKIATTGRALAAARRSPQAPARPARRTVNERKRAGELLASVMAIDPRVADLVTSLLLPHRVIVSECTASRHPTLLLCARVRHTPGPCVCARAEFGTLLTPKEPLAVGESRATRNRSALRRRRRCARSGAPVDKKDCREYLFVLFTDILIWMSP
jgi:hypothetical protein